MTLRLRLINDGKQPGDVAVIRGLKSYADEPAPGPVQVQMTDDLQDSITLLKGQEAIIFPPCEHFQDFKDLSIKGKH